MNKSDAIWMSKIVIHYFFLSHIKILQTLIKQQYTDNGLSVSFVMCVYIFSLDNLYKNHEFFSIGPIYVDATDKRENIYIFQSTLILHFQHY